MPPVTHVSTKWGDITPQMLAEIKAGYEAAMVFVPPAESFNLADGQTLLTAFAKHLIAFCEANGLVASDAPEIEAVEINGFPISLGQEIISKFFEGITGITAYSVDHIAIHRGKDVIAIISSPDLAIQLRKGASN
ncbi:MAG TPA: hypothetical protein VK181_12535 [Rhizobium sp.]|nr:hypothetical protein [Rhizobium sp.]